MALTITYSLNHWYHIRLISYAEISNALTNCWCSHFHCAPYNQILDSQLSHKQTPVKQNKGKVTWNYIKCYISKALRCGPCVTRDHTVLHATHTRTVPVFILPSYIASSPFNWYSLRPTQLVAILVGGGGLSVATWYDTAWIGGTASGEYLYRSVHSTAGLQPYKACKLSRFHCPIRFDNSIRYWPRVSHGPSPRAQISTPVSKIA